MLHAVVDRLTNLPSSSAVKLPGCTREVRYFVGIAELAIERYFYMCPFREMHDSIATLWETQ